MYKCFSCLKSFKYELLSYEFVHDIDLDLIGICKGCVNVPKIQWKIQPKSKYKILKIHSYSKEYNEYWKMVNEKAPDWTGYHETKNGTVFMYGNNKQILLPCIPDDKCICCANAC